MLDMLPALEAFLSANGIDRVFGEEVPSKEAKNMPRACTLVKTAGGVAQDFVTIGRTRIDVRTFGETPYQARTEYLKVYDLLKSAKAQAMDDVWFLSAVMESGPLSMRDPDTQWPYVMSIWNVMSREISL